MLGTTFYHATIRKYVVAVGTLFNNLQIRRFKGVVVDQTVPLPLTYEPKSKWYSRILADSKLDPTATNSYPIRMTVPRLAYNLTGMGYDGERKTHTLNKNKVVSADSLEMSWQYNRVPYKFNFELYGIFKQYDDHCQFLEQVLTDLHPLLIFLLLWHF